MSSFVLAVSMGGLAVSSLVFGFRAGFAVSGRLRGVKPVSGLPDQGVDFTMLALGVVGS